MMQSFEWGTPESGWTGEGGGAEGYAGPAGISGSEGRDKNMAERG
jgi:hypothetical protein